MNPQRILGLVNRTKVIYRQEGLFHLFIKITNFFINSLYSFFSHPDFFDYIKSKIIYYKYWIYYGDSAPHPYNLIEVNPCNINHWIDFTQRHKVKFLKYGTVIRGGEWDRKYLKTNRTKERFKLTAKSFEDHFIEEISWENTDLYQYAIESEEIHDMYNGRSNLEKRLGDLDTLYHCIENEGYKSQRDLEKEGVLSERRNKEIPWFAPPEVHEVGIAITRDGKLAGFYGGNHRLHIAKILKLDQIPVRVVIRHKAWQELRHEIAQCDSIDDLSEEAKNYLNHPDMQDVI